MISATARNYLEEGNGARLVILVFVTIGLGIVALGLSAAINTIWRLATIPAKLRERNVRSRSLQGMVLLAGELKLQEIIVGIFLFGICFAMTVLILLSAGGFLTRRGSYGGGGAAIVWPALSR